MSLRKITRWRYLHLDKAGNHLWEQDWSENNVTDEGEAWILNQAFRNDDNTSFAGFEVVLATNATLAENAVFATITELADTNGYTAKLLAQNTSDWSAPSGATPTVITTPSSGTHDYTASGGAWAEVFYAAITTRGMTTNRLVAFNALSVGRTLADGDTLKVDFDLQASGS